MLLADLGILRLVAEQRNHDYWLAGGDCLLEWAGVCFWFQRNDKRGRLRLVVSLLLLDFSVSPRALLPSLSLPQTVPHLHPVVSSVADECLDSFVLEEIRLGEPFHQFHIGRKTTVQVVRHIPEKY